MTRNEILMELIVSSVDHIAYPKSAKYLIPATEENLAYAKSAKLKTYEHPNLDHHVWVCIFDKTLEGKEIEVTAPPTRYKQKPVFKYVKGDIIQIGKAGLVDVIAHGCNCFNMMGAGLAPQMAAAFNAHKTVMETLDGYEGDFGKLGNIDIISTKYKGRTRRNLRAVNAYTQYEPGRDFRPMALEMCLYKMNHYFAGMVIALPRIGCGIAGGDWEEVEQMIIGILTDVKAIIIVDYDRNVVVENIPL